MQIWDNTSFYLNKVVYYIGFSCAAIFALSYFYSPLYYFSILILICLFLSVCVDSYLLYQKKGISSERLIADRFSNGDENPVSLKVFNSYPFNVRFSLIEDLPFQFQERNWKRYGMIYKNDSFKLDYIVLPKERGEYLFGNTNIFIKSPLQLIIRRFTKKNNQVIKVYPSYVQMRRYQLIAAAAHLQDSGLKRMRRLGHSMEFEQIKEYVIGDDYRTINWKATGRRSDLMVNQYTDEKSQQIYCIINKGRIMKMPFEGMTLLDYSINATLMLANVALHKHDKAGLICLSQKVDAFIVADKKPTQINLILDTLYKQQTNYLEPDLEQLFSIVRNRITNRSLLILFTNYESKESLDRELPYLKKLAHYHLLMVVFFDNTELNQLINAKVSTVEDIYIKTIAEKYRYDKRLIAKELNTHGIITVLSTPRELSINALNKYLEIKKRQTL